MRGLGQDEVDNILSNEAAYSGGNPYLTSPAFLASQAAALQANCAASPNDPSCQVAEATGDITSGYNPSADTVLNLTNYCQQNAQNNAIFGDALDTANCNGQVPNPAVIQAANTIAQQSSIPSVTSSIPGAITYAPPVTNPIVATTPIQSAVTPATTIVNQPSNASAAVANTTAQAQQQTAAQNSTGDATTDAAINWIESNWILLVGGLAALVILPSLLSKR